MAKQLRVESEAACVVALDISGDDLLAGALITASGEIAHRRERPLDGAGGDRALAIIADFAADMVGATSDPVERIGIGSAGIIDDTGVVRYATALKWRDIPLAAAVRDRTGIPTRVGNDLDFTALAATRFRGIDVRDLLVISLDNSVGMGIMVGGRLVEGEHFNAGEIAHVIVFDDGLRCTCGRLGCILPYVDAARSAADSAYISAEHRTQTIAAAGHALGALIAPIASALNLTTVVICGPGAMVTDAMIVAASETCANRALPLLNTDVTIVPIRDDNDLILLGAAAHAWSQ